MVFHVLLKTAKDSEKTERDLSCPKLPVHPPIFLPATQILWCQAEFPLAEGCISLPQSPGKLISFIPCNYSWYKALDAEAYPDPVTPQLSGFFPPVV